MQPNPQEIINDLENKILELDKKIKELLYQTALTIAVLNPNDPRIRLIETQSNGILLLLEIDLAKLKNFRIRENLDRK